MDITFTFSDAEVVALTADLTSQDLAGRQTLPNLLIALPALIAQTIVRPAVERQRQYHLSDRIEKLAGLSDAQLVEVDKTIDAQRADTRLEILASSVPESL